MNTESGESSGPSVENLRKERKTIRSKITRSVKRIKELSSTTENVRRLEKELEQLRKDYDKACEIHCEFYEFEGAHTETLDAWENELTDLVFGIEQEIEDRMKNLKAIGKKPIDIPSTSSTAPEPSTSGTTAINQEQTPPLSQLSTLQMPEIESPSYQTHTHSEHITPVVQLNANSASLITAYNNPNLPSSPQISTYAVDDWIDNLTEFQETVLAPETASSHVSIADALYKLEAGKGMPTVTLEKFDGDPLEYTDFIDRFKTHIHDKPHISDDMRMIQLRMHLIGDAERAISGLGSKGIFYATALKTIKEQFGQRGVIARALINNLTKGDRIGRNDRSRLRDFSIDLINCLATTTRIGFSADINANENLRKIIARLPDHLIERWRTAASDLREKNVAPNIRHISDFVRKRVKAEFDPDFGDINRGNKNDQAPPRERKGIFAALPQNGNHREPIKCYICEAEHKVTACQRLKNASLSDRLEMIKRARLCFSCLNRGHCKKECRSKKKCEVSESCRYFHHPLLHGDQLSQQSVSGMASILDKSTMMPVVRARFRAPSGRVLEGNVLIDSGAGTTVISRYFARRLGLQGRKERINLAVVGGEKIEEPESRRVEFWISALDAAEEFKIQAHEIAYTVLDAPPIDRTWLKSFQHLNGIEFTHKAGPVDLILGVQYSHLHAEEETRQGTQFQPVAKKTKIGWYVIGSENEKSASQSCSINFVQSVSLEKFYEFESLGVQARDCSCPKSPMSLEDKQALALLENSCELRDGRYTIGLPWKKDKTLLPNNRQIAEARLQSLERSLKKNPERAEMYHRAVAEYTENGWARPLSEAEMKADIKPVYYLPHHGIWRPDKISTPLRIVFDPASPYQGVCLNSFLHKGPGLVGNLLGVLLRFREEPVACVGDISKMFLQIRLPEEDTHVHRFLWRNLDTSQAPTVYALQKVAFGDKLSPDMASFVMLKIADEHKESKPRAATVLKRDRYMDDLIFSRASTDEAKESIKEINDVLATGSFKIKEWICSKDTSSNETEREECATNLTVNLDGMENMKTLRVVWNPLDDLISFASRKVKLERLTKRSILSGISSLYDPLGLASAVTIKTRIALQEIWKSKEYDWDDQLPDEMCVQWNALFQEIEELQTVRIPRCLRPSDVRGESELHVFADASGSAYGATAYLLWSTDKGPEARLVSAKARVAPLRQSTTPRLELMAALVATRLATTIQSEFKNKPVNVVLWSDSKIVLQWLRSDSASLKPFVGVRVAEIQSMASLSLETCTSSDEPS